MKKNITLLAIAFIGLFVIASCKKSSSSSSSPYSMSASKNGTTVSASGQSVYAVISGPLLEVVGENINGKDTTGFIFLVGDYTGAGTYSLSDTSSNTAEYASVSGTSGSLIIAQSGSLTIKAVTSTQITGTFTFTGMDGTQFTNGTFTAKL